MTDPDTTMLVRRLHSLGMIPCQIALHQIGPYKVSTAWLGSPPLYESMAFDLTAEHPHFDLRMAHYRTSAEALAGHARMVKLFERYWRMQCR